MSHLSFCLCDILSLEVWPHPPRGIILPVTDPAIFGHQGPGVRRWGIFCFTGARVPTIPFQWCRQPPAKCESRVCLFILWPQSNTLLKFAGEKKKPSCYFVCSPNISSHPLISKKGKEMTTGRVPASTKLGLNHQDWCSIAVISLPRLCRALQVGPTTSWSPHTSPHCCNPPFPSWGCCTPC